MSDATVLVVEDDATLREVLCDRLQLAGYSVRTADAGQAALEVLSREPVGMVVSDVQIRPMDGHKLLQRIKAAYPGLPVLLMSAYGTVEKAVRAMREGAVDYLVKPFDPQVLLNKIAHFIMPPQPAMQTVIAEDVRTRELLDLAHRVARSDVTVLLGGESGTGKEVFARYIHQQSACSEGPFVAINCAAIPDNMLEAVLFGYEKGAFTGAHQSVPGKFEQAQGGTLLLDEISEMSLGLQAKLLRVIQEKEVERLGGRGNIQLNVRVLTTTNRKLREEVAAGRFREDLFYRLNVFPLTLPPLRERPRDILPLADYLIRKQAAPGSAAPELSEQAKLQLLQHRWAGNVREMDNLIQRALILRRGDIIEAEDLCFEPEGKDELQGEKSNARAAGGLTDDLKSMEEKMILEALQKGNGNRKCAAERLGISQRTLRYKLAKLREAGVTIPR